MRKQLTDLRSKMKELGIDLYIVSDKDEHLSEYTDAHFCALEEFSGFTGGDGTLAVTGEKAALWVDGRYYIQAEQELAGSGIEMMKLGEPGTPAVTLWIAQELPPEGTLGFDGKCTSYQEGFMFRRVLKEGQNVKTDLDVCGLVWENRPEETCKPVWLLDEKYCGKSAAVKLADLKAAFTRMGAKTHIIAALDDIAWLLNLRGGDICHNPVFMAYLILTADGRVRLYSDERHFSADIRAYLESLGVELKPYGEVFADTAAVESPVLIDRKRASYELADSIPAGSRIIDRINPSMAEKCRKNEIEAENIAVAQHADALAVTRFMKWFKTEALPAVAGGTLPVTEWSCAEKLHALRAECPHFIEESFTTISAYGANASMAHYMPSAEHEVRIEPHGLYLVDSGGQYYEGTTDITRTLSCGETTAEEREAYTLAVIANLRLADARFLDGVSSLVLDYAAREPFWRRGMNYNHGTGHGVGHVLNVHEGPVGIRYKAATMEGAWPMNEGMYVSDEPGYYKEDAFGVRMENMLLCVKDYANEYGTFMKFKTCTLVPMDKTCLELGLMSDEDIRLLNEYHANVYAELSSDLNEEERAWLKEMCAPVGEAE